LAKNYDPEYLKQEIKKKLENRRVIIVSYRGPFTFRTLRNSKILPERTLGGVSTSLSYIVENYDSIWISKGDYPQNAEIKENGIFKFNFGSREYKIRPVSLTRDDVINFYRGFSNETLWPLSHGFLQITQHLKKYWQAYQRVNNKFASIINEIYQENDLIWIHDYHFALLPNILRKIIREPKIGFFWHIPWPPWEIFRTLPWRKEILKGLLGSDFIGFHIPYYVKNFFRCNYKILKLVLDETLGLVFNSDRIIQVKSLPLGIDAIDLMNSRNSLKVLRKCSSLEKTTKNMKIILGLGRLDYTKGILERLRAYEKLLNDFPEYHKKIVFILVASPSREKIGDYREIKDKVNMMVGDINGRFQSLDWIPIHYFHRRISSEQLKAFYILADVMVAIPLIDGMNLVCKEFIASNTNHGVLVLSEFAGAAYDLKEAIQVNPYDIDEVSKAIKRALDMDIEERAKRLNKLKKKVEEKSLYWWLNEYIENWFNALSDRYYLMNEKTSNTYIETIK
jgi:trehalose 6-phosphate synthase/phosphatase